MRVRLDQAAPVRDDDELGAVAGVQFGHGVREAREFADSGVGQALNPRVLAGLKTGTRTGSSMPAGDDAVRAVEIGGCDLVQRPRHIGFERPQLVGISRLSA